MCNLDSLLVEGFLKKQKSSALSSLISSYNKRWFSLNGKQGVLTYSSKKSKKVTRAIPFRNILGFEEPTPDNGFMKVVTPNKVYSLMAYSPQDEKVWVQGFKQLFKARVENMIKESESKDDNEQELSEKVELKQNEVEIDQVYNTNGPKQTVSLRPPSPLAKKTKVIIKQSANIADLCPFARSLASKKNTSNPIKKKAIRVSDPDSVAATEDSWNTKTQKTQNSSIEKSNRHKTEQPSFEDDWDNSDEYDDIEKIAKTSEIKFFKNNSVFHSTRGSKNDIYNSQNCENLKKMRTSKLKRRHKSRMNKPRFSSKLRAS